MHLIVTARKALDILPKRKSISSLLSSIQLPGALRVVHAQLLRKIRVASALMASRLYECILHAQEVAAAKHIAGARVVAILKAA